MKSGRTHLQDATPIRLGQEFTAYGHTVARHRAKLAQAADWLRPMNIGGSAVGTGINVEAVSIPALMVTEMQPTRRRRARGRRRPHPADAVDG